MKSSPGCTSKAISRITENCQETILCHHVWQATTYRCSNLCHKRLALHYNCRWHFPLKLHTGKHHAGGISSVQTGRVPFLSLDSFYSHGFLHGKKLSMDWTFTCINSYLNILNNWLLKAVNGEFYHNISYHLLSVLCLFGWICPPPACHPQPITCWAFPTLFPLFALFLSISYYQFLTLLPSLFSTLSHPTMTHNSAAHLRSVTAEPLAWCSAVTQLANCH